MDSPRLNHRSPAEHLADAERYELWAERCSGDETTSESFRKLAAEARARAAGEL